MIPRPPNVGSRLFQSSLRLAVLSLLAGLNLSSLRAEAVRVVSPDGRLRAEFSANPSEQLTYTVAAAAGDVVLPSPLGIIVNADDLGHGVQLGRATEREIHEPFPTRGVHAKGNNDCREAVIPITGGKGKTAWTLEVRVFNDGVAYRYRVPGNPATERTIAGESSGWNFPAGGTLWYQDSGSRDYEKEFVTRPLADLPQDRAIMSGCLLQLPGKLGYVMPTEANLVGYSDMILQPAGAGSFRARFPHDQNGWKQKGEIVSPWRVTLCAPDLNTLVNSDILRALCPPPAPELANANWVVPGRANWHWMVTGKPKFEDQRRWVDWTAQLGWEYYLIDDGWVTWKTPDKDQWALMQELVGYAAGKKVKLIAWVHTREVTEPAARLAYFKRAKETGLVGLKIDFMGEPNAHWVQWYDDTLRDAAAAHLLVDFHGCVKPTGRERTWPHELTREGIRGRENGKQSGVHDTTLPFTRYVQGPADFTPTDWRGDKLHGASWAHELAQAVVYTSPLLCYGGAPENYLQNEAADVLKAIPATWDETVVLPGSAPGEVAAFARRKGSEWFIGVINGDAPRKLEIPLGFLGAGAWNSDQWGDTPVKNDAWNRTKAPVNSQSRMTVDLRGNGGFVARLSR